ncbi:MAG TPA: cytochrome c oxidase subunit 3 [Gemmatimonadales bacterium]|nr:cytochrome c oxidase subunit 3 [Gemmatimonadales bacterium]
MRPVRVTADISALPRTVFGHRSLMWWGTIGYIMIEGTTLFICAVTYFYLRRNFATWPPQHIYRPAVLIPTIQAVLMLASNIPMRAVDRASRRMDINGVRRGLVICSILVVMITVLRCFEFAALKVRWDTSAYGSAAWATLVAHSTLLVLEMAETITITVMMFQPDVEERDLSGVSDNAVYWYFLTLVWIPLYVMVFLTPYFM